MVIRNYVHASDKRIQTTKTGNRDLNTYTMKKKLRRVTVIDAQNNCIDARTALQDIKALAHVSLWFPDAINTGEAHEALMRSIRNATKQLKDTEEYLRKSRQTYTVNNSKPLTTA